MAQYLEITLDEQPVRFTPDGKVSVLDAISALLDSEEPLEIWNEIKGQHPHVLDFCDYYLFDRDNRLPVVGSEGWDLLWTIFPEYAVTFAQTDKHKHHRV